MPNFYYIVESSKETPFVFINLIIVILNFGFFIFLNFAVYKKRRKNERDFTINYEFYKVFVISNIQDLYSTIRHSSDVMKQILEIDQSNLNVNEIRNNLDMFDNIYQVIENQLYPNISCYSKDLGKLIKTNFETYFDEIQEIVVSLVIPSVNIDSLKEKFLISKTTLSDKIQDAIEDNKPSY